MRVLVAVVLAALLGGCTSPSAMDDGPQQPAPEKEAPLSDGRGGLRPPASVTGPNEGAEPEPPLAPSDDAEPVPDPPTPPPMTNDTQAEPAPFSKAALAWKGDRRFEYIVHVRTINRYEEQIEVTQDLAQFYSDLSTDDGRCRRITFDSVAWTDPFEYMCGWKHPVNGSKGEWTHFYWFLPGSAVGESQVAWIKPGDAREVWVTMRIDDSGRVDVTYGTAPW